MRRIIILSLILIFTSSPVLAHDGSEHVGELELWVAGTGIISISAAGIYSLTGSKASEEQDPPSDTHPDTD